MAKRVLVVDDELDMRIFITTLLETSGYKPLSAVDGKEGLEIARQKRLSAKRIPEDLNYAQITSLRVEACEKLTRVRPASLEQAGRISGITPADIALLMAYLEGRVPRVPDASGSGVEEG